MFTPHRSRWYPFALSSAVCVSMGLSQTALAQSDSYTLPSMVVTATRTPEDIANVPASVTVIEREEIEAQSKTSRTLGEILGRLTPGLATGSGTQSNSGQTLRGRGMLVLIDGVPQTAIRNASRDLYTIDPAAIERVEIIRGSSAMYGQGASGGVINIITKAPTKQGQEFTTEVGAVSSLTKLDSESLGGTVRQSVSGRNGAFDYLLNGSVEHIGGAFDADGDRIPPEPSQGDLYDTTSLNLLGKLGWTGDKQRLEFTANTFLSEQDTDYVSDPSVNSQPTGTQARAIKGLQLDDQGETENSVFNVSYRHDDVLGSRLDSQIYYRDYYTRFFPFDGRPFAAWNAIAQSYVESEVWGARMALDTPLLRGKGRDVSLLWGADYADEKTEQRVTTFDPDAYDASGGLVFDPIADRGLVPPMDHQTLGLFAQLEWVLTDRWTLRGGARHERIELSVNDYVTLGQGYRIQGGEVDYHDTVYNIGATFAATDAIQLFASYAEGFSLPDIGLILRQPPNEDFQVSRSNLEPIKVDNYEIGARGDWKNVRGSLAVFYSTSDLGVRSDGFAANVVRAPERTYGLEATLDVYPNDDLAVGGTFTWIEGEYENDDGNHVALDGWRIPPPKLTAYIEHNTRPGWTNRLQALYSGERDRAAKEGTGRGRQPLEDFLVFDFISSLEVGPGVLGIGIENLLNEDYYNVYAQLMIRGNETHFRAPGRTLRLSYAINY